MPNVRCSIRSAALGEPMIGTASHVRRLLLVEVPGPWGVEAIRDARIPREVRTALTRYAARTKERVLFIRRFGRREPRDERAVFQADVAPANPSLRRTVLPNISELRALATEPMPPGDPISGPMFLVCTHGRHDICCAEQGRPLVRALSAVEPEATWESSHIGGDRFAGNLLCLPHGMYFGRVTPEDAPAVAAAYRAGRIDLPHLRGRGAYGFATQAAEWHLRTKLGLDGLDDLRLVGRRADGDHTEAVFEVRSQGTWSVRISIGHAPPHRLTCSSKVPHPAPRFRLEGIEQA